MPAGVNHLRPDVVLFEREHEMTVADRCLARAHRGDGGVLLVEGAAGIGKSALLAAICGHADRMGFEVLSGRGSELEGAFAFGIARQLLERRTRAATGTDRDALLRGAASAALVPLGLSDGPGDDATHRSLHGLYWLVANASARGPLLLCVDDAHWADAASVRWLVYLAQRLAGLRVAIVVAARPADSAGEDDLLRVLGASQVSEVLTLHALSPESVGALVDRLMSAEAASEFKAACHERTGGNPMLVRELLLQLVAEGAGPSRETARSLQGYGVDAVNRNVRRRLGRLGIAPTAVARALAVLGGGATVGGLAAVCKLDPVVVRDAVVALIAADLVADESHLAFVHPLIRTAVYDDMAIVERAWLHGAAAAALMSDATDPEHAGLHLLHAERRGDGRIVDALKAASASATTRGAPDAATTFLRRALEEPPAGESRIEVLRMTGEAEALGGLPGFEEHLALALRETADPQEAAAIALTLARALWPLGAFARAYDVVDGALKTVTPGSPLALELEGELLGLANAFAPLRAMARARAEGHIHRLERGGSVDPALLPPLALWLLRDHPPASRAVALIETATVRDPGASEVPDIFAGAVLFMAGDLTRAAELCDARLADLRERGSSLQLMLALVARALVSYGQGEVVRSEADARAAWEIATGEGGLLPAEPFGLLRAGGALINALVARGELDEAEGCLRELPDPLPERAELLLPARAELRLAQGRVEDAIADLRLTGALIGDEFPKLIQNWRTRLAVTLATVGEVHEARSLAAAELEQARRFDVPLAIGAALTASGVATGGTSGIELLREAVEVLEQTGGRLEHAVSLVELGALLRRTGSPAVARDPLRAGMDLASRCGATALADRAHAELVAAGGRPRQGRRYRTGPESLTAGEYRVAALAAQGLTNRAIAQRLYVTQSAVQFHLRNAFRKLDVSARGQLATALGVDGEAASPKDWSVPGSEDGSVQA